MANVDDERWLPVVGLDGFYEVSSLGRIRGISRRVPFKNSTRGVPGTVIKPQRFPGSMRCALKRDGRAYPVKVHRVVAAAFIGVCPSGEEVLHGDGDFTNNAVTNLRYGTRIENAEDARRHGTIARGERQGSAKLSREAVNQIVLRMTQGETQASIAFSFGITCATVSAVWRGQTWAHVTGITRPPRFQRRDAAPSRARPDPQRKHRRK
jgi:hypothetical protein